MSKRLSILLMGLAVFIGEFAHSDFLVPDDEIRDQNKLNFDARIEKLSEEQVRHKAGGDRDCTRPDVLCIFENKGGSIRVYQDAAHRFAASGGRLKVFGECDSACTFFLTAVPEERICVGPRARFGFHEKALGPRLINAAGVLEATFTPSLTDKWIEQYPEKIQFFWKSRRPLRHLVDSKGHWMGNEDTMRLAGDRAEKFNDFIYLEGDELRKIYKPCSSMNSDLRGAIGAQVNAEPEAAGGMR